MEQSSGQAYVEPEPLFEWLCFGCLVQAEEFLNLLSRWLLWMLETSVDWIQEESRAPCGWAQWLDDSAVVLEEHDEPSATALVAAVVVQDVAAKAVAAGELQRVVAAPAAKAAVAGELLQLVGLEAAALNYNQFERKQLPPHSAGNRAAGGCWPVGELQPYLDSSFRPVADAQEVGS